MKLIGSRAEAEIRRELLTSNRALIDGNSALARALSIAGADLSRCFVLNWTPEQEEDIYCVLISADEVLILEISRHNGQVQVEREPILNFERECSKNQRLRIAVARDLLKPTGLAG